MSDKLLVIISSSDPGKAMTGLAFATNARKNGWMENIKLMVFGPAEHLLLVNAELQRALQAYMELDKEVMACKVIADKANDSEELANLGLTVDYVGAAITHLIKQGYTPMVW